ncbi:hypothetical protein T440DRAFT_169415 [Plenodomus tracheiphilus IPT5]|uniref:Uncharacterized protein n=1 Tax=Plenodomus tracheiphilus IPT5 TaxID=1408161 RepID=A0A6A7AYH4_9PLEO|nr:hypothetical protein T440DRAFT_169415 [Plenodomus tracheiphilus IPT5]
MSSSSNSDRSSHRKCAAPRETIVSRNNASGNALQINGDAVDQMWNIQVENVYISYRVKVAADAACPGSGPPQPEVSTLKQPSTRKRSEKTIENGPGTNSNLSIIPAQSVVLYPRLSGTHEVVRATFQPSIVENFITRRIVRRLKLEIDGRCPIPKTLLWGEMAVPPITTFVDIACSSGKSNRRITYRFYIARRCQFDVLFGLDSLGSIAD